MRLALAAPSVAARTVLLLADPLLSLGIYTIFPAQTFATPDPSFRLWETLVPVLELPVLLALVCLPVVLPITPPGLLHLNIPERHR